MPKPVTIPNTFATATTAIPLTNLDADFTAVASTVNDANSYSNYAADTGAANAYVVTLTGITTTYTAGLRIQFKALNANTTASTVNVNGQGAKNITFQDTTALVAGTIAANAIVDVMYDGTQFLLMNDPAGTVGTGDVVGPASATDNAVVRFDGTTGKLVQNSVVTIADSTGDVAGVGALTMGGNLTLSGGTANGVLYLNGSKVATSGSALTFDGNKLSVGNGTEGTVYFNGASFGLIRSLSDLYYDGNAQIFRNAAGSSEYMRLTSTGLGIGTSSPATKLDVRAAAGSGGFITLVNTTAFANTNVIETSYTLNNSTSGLATAAVIGVTNPAATANSYGDIYFKTTNPASGLVERMRLDSSGNLGLGVTPSAWDSASKAFQISSHAVFAAYTSGTNQQALLLNNAYLSATGYKYLNSNYATYYQQQASAGTHAWFTAPSGTAGNAITFTQALTLDANRNLLLNGTSAGASAVGTLTIFNGTAPTGSVTDGIILYAQDVSSSSELKVRDEAGNVTTLSPHNFSLIPEGPSEDMAWAYYSEKGGKRINVDMLKLARMVEKLTGEKLVYES